MYSTRFFHQSSSLSLVLANLTFNEIIDKSCSGAHAIKEKNEMKTFLVRYMKCTFAIFMPTDGFGEFLARKGLPGDYFATVGEKQHKFSN